MGKSQQNLLDLAFHLGYRSPCFLIAEKSEFAHPLDYLHRSDSLSFSLLLIVAVQFAR